MYCRQCGENLGDIKNTRYCPLCGANIANEVKVKEYEQWNCRDWKEWVPFFSMIIFAVLAILFWPRYDTGKDQATNVEEEIDTIIKEFSLSEQLEQAFEMGDNGFVEEGEEMLQEIMLEHQYDPDAYLCLSGMSIDRQEVKLAKEVLLLGFEKTEDSRLMDEYLDISMQYAEDGNGEFYEKLMDFVEMYAQVTDNEEKLEVANKIYMYVKSYQ